MFSTKYTQISRWTVLPCLSQCDSRTPHDRSYLTRYRTPRTRTRSRQGRTKREGTQTRNIEHSRIRETTIQQKHSPLPSRDSSHRQGRRRRSCRASTGNPKVPSLKADRPHALPSTSSKSHDSRPLGYTPIRTKAMWLLDVRFHSTVSPTVYLEAGALASLNAAICGTACTRLMRAMSRG